MAKLRFGYFIAPFHRAGTNPTLALQRDLEFIEHVDARGHGWEVRFAQKFGVIYAAMMMGMVGPRVVKASARSAKGTHKRRAKSAA